MWVSELLTEDNFVNGSSFLIAAGILSDIPGRITGGLNQSSDRVMIITSIVSLLWIGFIIVVTSGERRLTIKHSKVMSFGRKEVKDNHIPLKLNQAGVMPVIFALSFLSTPTLIIDLLMKSDYISNLSWISGVQGVVSKITNPDLIYYNLVLTLLIIIFSIFYTFVIFNPEDIAKNLQKQGAYIPGVRPGEETTNFLTKIMLRLSFAGSIFLAFITLIPLVIPKILQATWTLEFPDRFINTLSQFSLFSVGMPNAVVNALEAFQISKDWSITVPIFFSGTAILIVIRVALDVLDKIKSLKTEKYSVTGI